MVVGWWMVRFNLYWQHLTLACLWAANGVCHHHYHPETLQSSLASFRPRLPALPPPRATMQHIAEPELCYYFHHPNKRCKKGQRCTFKHDDDHPTRWQEVAQRRAANADLALFPEIAGFGPGVLRETTVATKAYFRKLGLPSFVQVQTTRVVPDGTGTHWFEVDLYGMRKASALAHEVVMRAKSVGSNCLFVDGIRVTGVGTKLPELFYHGTDKDGWLSVLRDGYLKAGTAEPVAVYAGVDPRSTQRSGYDFGFIIKMKVVAFEASKATAKQLTQPVPGVTYQLKRAALSEWVFHEESCEVVGFLSQLNYFGQLVREALTSEAPPPKRLRTTPPGEDAPAPSDAPGVFELEESSDGTMEIRRVRSERTAPGVSSSSAWTG